MWELDKDRVVAGRTVGDQKAAELHGMSEKREWGKRDKLFFAGLALFFVGVGVAVWLSNVGISMWLVGILLAGIAVNERLISWAAVGVLGLYLIVTALVLLFHMAADAADLGINWLDYISWFFRVVGATVSLPMIGFLWLIVAERRRVYTELPSEHPPSDLPAAAVSELVDRDERPRTPFTIVLEMLQKGTLEIAGERGSPERYRLTAKRGRKYEWEQTVSDALPQRPVSRFDLLKRLNEPELGVRRQIHEYLQHRGLLHHERVMRARNIWFAALAVLGSILMSVGLALWIVRLGPAWPVGLAMIGAAYVAGMWIAYRQNEKLNEVTAAGRLETRRWRGFGAHLESATFDEEREADFGGLDSLMPYAVALNRVRVWREERQVSEEPPSDMAAAIAESWRQDKAATVIGFIAGAYIGSYIYPGEGIVERIFDFSEFSATFGAFGGGGGGSDGGGGDGDFGDGGDFGGGGDFDISF